MKAFERHNIFELIGQRQYVYHSAVLTCYTFDPIFFNTYFMPRLRACGITNVVVMMDASNYDQLLAEYPNYKLDTSNQTYTLIRQEPNRHGVFHPKIIVLIGQESGMLFVGSGNLTYSGFSLNEEIWGAFSLNGSDSLYAPLFTDTWSYLSHISHSEPLLVRQQFQWMLENSSWLNDVLISSGNHDVVIDGETFRFICNEKDSIINQVNAFIGNASVSSIQIVSPFYDVNGGMIDILHQRFSHSQIRCVVTKDGTYPYDMIINPPFWLSFHLWDEICNREENVRKKLHGKLMQFDTEEGTFLVIGSANLTSNAMNGINDEACLLIKSEKTRNYFNELGINIEDANVIKTEEKSTLIKPERKIQEKESKSYHIRSCEKIDERITVYSDIPDGKIILSGISFEGEKCFEKELISKNGIIADSDNVWGKAVMVVFVDINGNELSNRCFVFLDELINRCNPNQAFRKLESLLNASSNWKSNLMNILSYVYFENEPREKESKNQRILLKKQKKDDSGKIILKDDFDNIIEGSKHSILSKTDVRIIEFLLQSTNISKHKDRIFSKVSDDLDGISDINDGSSSYQYEEEDIDDLTKYEESVVYYCKRLDKFYNSKLESFYSSNKETKNKFILQPIDGKELKVNDYSQILISVVLMWNIIVENSCNRHELFLKLLIGNLGKFTLISRKGYEKRNDYASRKLEEYHREMVVYSLLVIGHFQWIGKSEIIAKLIILNLLDTYKNDGVEMIDAIWDAYINEKRRAVSVINVSTNILIEESKNDYKNFLLHLDDKSLIHPINYDSYGEIIYKKQLGFLYGYDFKPIMGANGMAASTYKVSHPGFDEDYVIKSGTKIHSLK